jgi:hypothetical protein
MGNFMWGKKSCGYFVGKVLDLDDEQDYNFKDSLNIYFRVSKRILIF